MTSSNSYYEKTLATGAVRCIDNEIPFEIPQGWEWCRMGSIGDWGAGATPNKGNHKYYGGNILWLRTGELNESYVYDTEIKITEVALKECSLRINKVGDILIAMYGATIGKVAIAGVELTTNQACCGCTPIEINNKFLFYFLMGSKDDFIKKGEGGAQPNISREKLIHHLIPIPPRKEQDLIVSKVESLLPIINTYDKIYNHYKELNDSVIDLLKKSILQEAIQGRLVPQIESEGTAEELLEEIRTEKKRLVKEGKLKKSAIANESHIFRGDDNKYYTINNGNMVEVDEILFDIPNSWSWVRLGEIFDHNTGKALNGKGSGNLLRKYLTTSNLYWDYFDFSKIKEMYFSDSEIEKCTITKGDLLVCEGGDVGRAAIWSYDYDMCIQNHIHRLRAYLPICTRFFYYVLRYYKYIGLIGGKGIGIQGLSSKALHDIIIPLPTLAEQERISSHLDFVLASIMSR